jgi:hypothetical protein
VGFMDKAKAAANELAAKADTALTGSGLGGPGAAGGQGERLLRDLGVLTYLEAAGRPLPAGERERVLAELREADQRGALPNLGLLTTAGGAVPPPPGAADAGPTPPGAAGGSPPPPGPGSPAEPESSGPTVPPSSPPPPPPSWAGGS